MNLKSILLLVVPIFVMPLFGQNYIKGRLFDSNTGEAVVFANVRIKDRALGIITNIDGSFRIPLKYKEYGDIIEISSMGYVTKEIPISDFYQDKLNIIKIEPGAINLKEAVVRGKDKSKRNLDAKEIVQRAINRIADNYSNSSFSTVGYYRDYQFNEGEYFNLNEALLEVFDQGFNRLDDATSKTRLFSLGLNEDFEIDSMARTAYNYESMSKIIKKAHLDAHGGNEFRILRIHDAIRNYTAFSYDFIGVFKDDLIEKHFFLRSGDTSIDNEEAYTIKFWVFYPNYRANGTIYIGKPDYAIHKLEYTMYDDKKWNNQRKKNKHGHRQKMIYDITTDYRRMGDKMFLNYISFQNTFILNIPPVFVVDFITVDKNRKCFVIEYNRVPHSEMALNLSNYTVKFKDKRIKMKRALRLKKKVYLYPNLKDEKINEMIKEISEADEKGENLHELLDLKITDVRDVNGNLINKWTQKEYLQFREFFVQQVKLESRATLEGVYMDKQKPLFENQPIDPPENFDDYWMNTPLQRVDEFVEVDK